MWSARGTPVRRNGDGAGGREDASTDGVPPGFPPASMEVIYLPIERWDERRKAMDSNRGAALCAGVLFIISTAASLAGTALSAPILNDPDLLTRVGSNASLLVGGVLLLLVAAGASAGIAISLYPVLKRWGAGMALGSVVFRTLEAAMYAIGAVSLLSLLPLARQFTDAGATERASLATLGEAFLGVRDEAVVAGVLAFCVGALLYSWLLYESNLVPRWLSGWGIAALFLMFAACLLAVFNERPVTSYVILALPIGLQEMGLALWLIAKGFSSAAFGSVQPQPATAGPADEARALIQVHRAHP
jgi:hypothetical protein